MKGNRILGCCKECNESVHKKNELEAPYQGIYECPKCGYPNNYDDLSFPLMSSAFVLALEDIESMRVAGDILSKHLGLHSQALKSVEEGAEYMQALLKYLRHRDEQNLTEVFMEYFDMLATATQVIRLLVNENPNGNIPLLIHAVGIKLDKLESYADIARGFTCTTDASNELEQFQKQVEKSM